MSTQSKTSKPSEMKLIFQSLVTSKRLMNFGFGSFNNRSMTDCSTIKEALYETYLALLKAIWLPHKNLSSHFSRTLFYRGWKHHHSTTADHKTFRLKIENKEK
ncbi:hypothetical protein BO225_10860 [Dubosiella newyorkensis]|uniref:Uncharacterized protein n=1 Tax=Dubosiella newyorkensis TaxID=1862672 RepID=A0A1U7NK50_9FIRM|nr:hypothetical protein BO225_10860 [Dubosiella newyorkensis]